MRSNVFDPAFGGSRTVWGRVFAQVIHYVF
ncbi:hypothetical protein CCAE64S_01666 [Castellaniella caeni]